MSPVIGRGRRPAPRPYSGFPWARGARRHTCARGSASAAAGCVGCSRRAAGVPGTSCEAASGPLSARSRGGRAPRLSGELAPSAWLRDGWPHWGLGDAPSRLSTLLVTGGPRSVSKVVLLAFAEPSPVPLVAVKAPRVDEAVSRRPSGGRRTGEPGHAPPRRRPWCAATARAAAGRRRAAGGRVRSRRAPARCSAHATQPGLVVMQSRRLAGRARVAGVSTSAVPLA